MALDGLEEFAKNVKRLAQRSKTAARKYVVELAREVRNDLRDALPGQKNASIRKTAGYKVRSNRKAEQIEGKVGFGVGSRGTPRRTKASIARGGVGITKNNVHWWVLGAKDRSTKAGKSRGRMPARRGLIAIVLHRRRHLDTLLLGRMRAEIEGHGS